jgi:hypothetical protein
MRTRVDSDQTRQVNNAHRTHYTYRSTCHGPSSDLIKPKR